MRFNRIDRVILFGGSPLLVAAAEWLRATRMQPLVYTAPRQAAERLDDRGTTLGARLESMGQPFVVCDDINQEPGLLDRIDEHTLGLGLGEAWSFDRRLIERFGGRLVDYMGIPLPRYRGGAHYSWMILSGDRRMACNIQVINEEMVQGEVDTGALLKTKVYRLPDDARLPADYFAGAVPVEVAFLREFLEEVQAGHDFEPVLPDESASLFFPRLMTLKQGWIDWSWTVDEIERFICAFDEPYAGASTHLDGETVQLKGARRVDDGERFHPFQAGLVTRVHGGKVFVAARGGHLAIERVLREGRSIVAELRHGMRFHTPAVQLDEAARYRARYGASVAAPAAAPTRAIGVDERFTGEQVLLRLVTEADCGDRYVGWLRDPAVNRYLETRFREQTLDSVREFVRAMVASADSYLFAIVERSSGAHIGNLKIGPIQPHHGYADVSYFIGERDRWGRGYATDAIRIATRIGFDRLGLHRLQAGVYGANAGSARALEKAGYRLEGTFRSQLRTADGWDDHLWFGLLRADGGGSP